VTWACRRKVVVGSGCLGTDSADPYKRIDLIHQNSEDKFRVKLWVINMARLETTILVVFYQVMVGIAGEGERIEPESINQRLLKQ